MLHKKKRVHRNYYVLNKYIIEVYFVEFILSRCLIIFTTQKYKNKIFLSSVVDFYCMISLESIIKEGHLGGTVG